MDYTKEKDEFEKAFVIRALETFKGINKAAVGANMPKKTLMRKIQKFGIDSSKYHYHTQRKNETASAEHGV